MKTENRGSKKAKKKGKASSAQGHNGASPHAQSNGRPSIKALDEVTARNVEGIARMEKAFHNHRTVGEGLADFVAECVGSWTFLIIQTSLLIAWVIVNVLAWWGWDPYPFVLLNLFLSIQAAFAAPIILMSENRQARLTERRHHLDLQVNLLAEQENTEQLRLLRLLCQKAGVSLTDPAERALEEKTQPDAIVDQIKEQVETTSDRPRADARRRP